VTAVRGTGGLLLPLLVVAALSGVSCGREGANDPALAKETRGGATTSPETDPHSVVVEAQQLEGMKIETVRDATFQVEKTATGRIAFNEDVATPVFSPYTGRVLRLLAKPGDEVRRGVPLFEIDTPDLVQAESDLISAQAAVIKARNQLDLAQRAAARQRDLYEARAVAQKDYEQAQSDLRAAESEVRAAEGVHAGARDRLRVFGKTDAEIAKIEETRQIDRVTHVPSPLAGTITTRKVGPGQYVKPDNPDPLFTIADLSTMWMLANVYEADIPLIQVGQPVEVQVLAYPNEVFRARISYIGASADPTTHRIAVRAEVANSSRKLKPEMFAGFRILTSDAIQSPSVPARAIVREGNTPTVWVGKGPNRFTRREVKLGLEQNGIVQVLAGLQPGEQVVAEGALFLSNASRGAQ
jgi:membrane fusion protein, heavy metal efflux system